MTAEGEISSPFVTEGHEFSFYLCGSHDICDAKIPLKKGAKEVVK